jgi:acyl-CoA thioester hydrolase
MAELNIRIDWSELDLYGHVNNVMIFKYVQGARINYCSAIGLGTLNEKEKTGFIVAASNVQYKKKILFPGDIRIETHVSEIKNTSFRLDHVIFNGNGEPVVEAYDIIVTYDYEKNDKQLVPAGIRSAMEKLEGRLFGDSSKSSDLAQYPDIE